MKALFFLALIYFGFKTAKRLLSNFRVENTDSSEIRGRSSDSSHHLHVDESDIEDAEFNDLD